MSTIGLLRVFSLAGWSRLVHAGFHVPRATQDAATPRMLARTRLSRSAAQLSRCFRLPCRVRVTAVLQPRPRLDGDGLGSSLFARHYWGNHSYFLFLRVLRCFSSPRTLPSCEGWCPFKAPGCPIRASPDQWPLAPTRGFSQLAAPFIARKSLGIRRAPLLSFPGPRLLGAGPFPFPLHMPFLACLRLVCPICQ